MHGAEHMGVMEILDTLYGVYGGLWRNGIRSLVFAMVPLDTSVDGIKVALAFSSEKRDDEGFLDVGTPLTVIFNEKTTSRISIPHHQWPMKAYDLAEVEAMLREFDDLLADIRS